MAVEWGGDGVRVVGVAPGPIAGTEGMRRLGQFPLSYVYLEVLLGILVQNY